MMFRPACCIAFAKSKVVAAMELKTIFFWIYTAAQSAAKGFNAASCMIRMLGCLSCYFYKQLALKS